MKLIKGKSIDRELTLKLVKITGIEEPDIRSFLQWWHHKERKIRAKKETNFDIKPDVPLSLVSVPIATIAPTIITAEIAFVTDIRGVCRAGVTDHTT